MQTVLDFLIRQVSVHPTRTAFHYWEGGRWHQSTWSELAADTATLGESLRSLGIARGQPVAILAENSYAWVQLDLALQAIGALSVPLQTQLSAEQVDEQLRHAGVQWVFVSTPAQARKVRAGDDRRTVSIDFHDPRGLSFDSLRRTPRPNAGEWLGAARERLSEDDFVTLLYTSGTSGEPKGVLLTHRNVVQNAIAKVATLPLGPEDLRICWLPLSHIFARTCDLFTGLLAGCETVLSRGKDFLLEECARFRPTYLNAVPYFYERCFRDWRQQGARREGSPSESDLRQWFGGRLRLANCGGAPLAEPVWDAFRSAGIELVTGYGLTEASPVVSSNRPDRWKRGSVGQPLPGVDVRIEAGEVWVRGPNIMAGYYRNPLATERAICHGWLRTGDLGWLDSDGFLFLNGRKDDLIVLNTAKKVAPAELENLILSNSLFQQCCLVGNGQNGLMALLVLQEAEWHRRARQIESDGLEVDLDGVIRTELALTLQSRADFEQVRQFILLPEPFRIENGMLTAKQSLRRKEIAARYAAEIEKYSTAKTLR